MDMYENSIFSRERKGPTPLSNNSQPSNSPSSKFLARRDRLRREGIQFKNHDSLLDVILYVDIPYFVMNLSYGDVCLAIGDRIAYRLALSQFKDSGCLPQNDKVRMKLTYELNDLPFHEDEHTAKLLHQRLLEHLQARVHIKVPYHQYVEENKIEELYEPLIIREWVQQ